MYFNFAAWLTIWSIATQMKSMNIRSTIGRSPVHRRADAQPDDGLFADRRIDDPFVTELLLQTGVRVEHTAECADVLARAEHVGIGLHRRGARPR